MTGRWGGLTRGAAALVLLVANGGCGGADRAPGPGWSAASGGGPSSSGGTASSAGASSGGGVPGSGGSSAGSGTGGAGAAATGGAAGADQAPFPNPDWAVGSALDHGLDPQALDAAAQVAQEKGSYCFLVIRHGVVVAEHYWNGHEQTTPERSWSIAKSYSSTLVGIAIDRGDLGSLDDKVADYIPEWKGTEHEVVTIRDVLRMSSGLDWSAFQDYVGMATFAQDHSKFALGLKQAKPPGQEWVYNNAGVQVLEPLFRNATGMTIEQYAEKYLWSKLGMKASWAHDPSGNPTAYASVLASCRDHARLGYLYLQGGRWGTQQVVPAGWVKTALTPSQPMNRAYGLLWWLNAETPAVDAMMKPWPGRMVPFAPTDHFAARGFGNQFVDVFPSLDLLVVRFGPDPLATFDLAALTTDQRFETHDAILKPVLDAITD